MTQNNMAALALRNLKILLITVYKEQGEEDLFYEFAALIDQALNDAKQNVWYETPASVQAEHLELIARLHANADGREEANTDDLAHAARIISETR